MSRVLSQQLLQHVRSPVTSLCTCWKITKIDGEVLTFTDNQRDVHCEGLTYSASVGFDPSAIESTSAMNVDNLEVDGLLDRGFISSADLAAGAYDGAEVEVFYVNRLDPAMGVLPLKKGTIGQADWQQGSFKAEVRGLLQPFQQNIVEVFSKTCRASLGDSRCKVDLLAKTVPGTVGSVSENRSFTDPARTEPDDRFAYGLVKFTSGQCNGLPMEVKTFKGGVVELMLAMPRPVVPGDTYTINWGCDGFVSTCRDTFHNVFNFRGFPDIPDPADAMHPK